MNPDLLFSIATATVIPGWLLLVLLPRWKWTTSLVAPVLLPALLGLLYLYLIAVYWAGADGGFGSLAQIARLFDQPYLLLAGWIHYLAFDLFVGAWEVRDAGRLGISHLVVVPCLLLTLMFGPVGLVLYLGVRAALSRTILTAELAENRG